MAELTQETRDELLMAIAAIVLGHVPYRGEPNITQASVPMSDADRQVAWSLLQCARAQYGDRIKTRGTR